MGDASTRNPALLGAPRVLTAADTRLARGPDPLPDAWARTPPPMQRGSAATPEKRARSGPRSRSRGDEASSASGPACASAEA
eukprot:8885968-Alexandrium_andersonii.AAC.1